jgi:hypothetical protein
MRLLRKVRLSAAIVVTALLVASAWTSETFATLQQLNCVLTDIGTQPESEKRAVIIVFDEGVKTLKAEASGQGYSFSNISISNVSINGEADSVSVGIDRSSLGIVWQQYGADKVVTEYGQCRRNDHPAGTVGD